MLDSLYRCPKCSFFLDYHVADDIDPEGNRTSDLHFICSNCNDEYFNYFEIVENKKLQVTSIKDEHFDYILENFEKAECVSFAMYFPEWVGYNVASFMLDEKAAYVTTWLIRFREIRKGNITVEQFMSFASLLFVTIKAVMLTSTYKPPDENLESLSRLVAMSLVEKYKIKSLIKKPKKPVSCSKLVSEIIGETEAYLKDLEKGAYDDLDS